MAESDSAISRFRARLNKGDQVFVVYPCEGDERACIATKKGRAIVFELPLEPEAPVSRAQEIRVSPASSD